MYDSVLYLCNSLQEAAHEAEEKERAAKAAKKAWQEQQARMQAQESSPKVVSPIVSIAESTAHEAMDVTGCALSYYYSTCSSYLVLTYVQMAD